MDLNKLRIIAVLVNVIAAITFTIMEWIKPYNREQNVFRPRYFDDLVFYNFFQSIVLGIVIFLIEGVNKLDNISGYKLIWDWLIDLQVLFFKVTHDLYIYLFHKWQYKNKYLWRIREAHHSPKNVDWLLGVRSHTIKILISQFIEFLSIVLLEAKHEATIYKRVIITV